VNFYAKFATQKFSEIRNSETAVGVVGQL